MQNFTLLLGQDREMQRQHLFSFSRLLQYMESELKQIQIVKTTDSESLLFAKSISIRQNAYLQLSSKFTTFLSRNLQTIFKFFNIMLLLLLIFIAI